MIEERRANWERTEKMQWAQLLILAATVIGIFLSLGRKDLALEQAVAGVADLQKITIDLAKTQASMLEKDRGTGAMLDDIMIRLRSLEGKQR